MMKYGFIFLVFAAFLSGCGLIDKLIPDVDTTYSETFDINLGSSYGETEVVVIDVTNSEDYDDFEDNIKGYSITSIKFQILDYDAPDDLYFSADVKVFDISGGDDEIVAEISRLRLSDYADTGEKYDAVKIAKVAGKVVKWLESPGRFNMWASYTITDAAGDPYVFNPDISYRFRLKIIYYVTVETGT